MQDYTKNGLKILMIAIIVTTIGTIVLSLLLHNFFNTIVQEEMSIDIVMNMFFTIIPGTIIVGIGGLLLLIGAILLLVGRKEFGEKHQKFITYALVIWVISFVIGIILGAMGEFMSSSTSSFSVFSTPDTSEIISSINTAAIINAASGIISAVLGGLVWVFGLYHLEDKKGKNVLFGAYAATIATAVISNVYILAFYDDLIKSEIFQSAINSESYTSASQILTLFQGFGDILIIALIGGIITNILLFFAIYIAYQRISSGELVPVTPVNPNLRMCKTCGRQGPTGSVVCAYCGSRFGPDPNQPKRCMSCGRVVPSDSSICPYCGKPV
jgi:hypothetical protein